MGVLLVTPMLLIRAHDISQQPEYWYEIVFHGFNVITLDTMRSSLVYGNYLNTEFTKEMRNVIFICLVGNCTWFIYLTFSYYVWVQVLNFQYPIPFLGFQLLWSFIAYNIAIWFRFPLNWRTNAETKQRIKSLCKLALFCATYQIIHII